MEQTKDTKPGHEISSEQATDVAGGAECSPGVTINIPGIGSITGPSVSQVYDDVVDGASHVIETVANATKTK